jgi:hypothetical protein
MSLLSVFEQILLVIAGYTLVFLASTIFALVKNTYNIETENDSVANIEMRFDNNEFFQTKSEFISTGNVNSFIFKNVDSIESRCEYCNTKHTNEEKSCSGCGAPL